MKKTKSHTTQRKNYKDKKSSNKIRNSFILKSKFKSKSKSKKFFKKTKSIRINNQKGGNLEEWKKQYGENPSELNLENDDTLFQNPKKTSQFFEYLRYLNEKQKLQKLNLKNTGMRRDAFRELCVIMGSNKSIKELDISDNLLCNQECTINENLNLLLSGGVQHLNLSHSEDFRKKNKIYTLFDMDDFVNLFSPAHNIKPNLKYIDLSGFYFGPVEIYKLSLLETCKGIRSMLSNEDRLMDLKNLMTQKHKLLDNLEENSPAGKVNPMQILTLRTMAMPECTYINSQIRFPPPLHTGDVYPEYDPYWEMIDELLISCNIKDEVIRKLFKDTLKKKNKSDPYIWQLFVLIDNNLDDVKLNKSDVRKRKINMIKMLEYNQFEDQQNHQYFDDGILLDKFDELYHDMYKTIKQ
jgi:hypothetical protein